MAHSDIIAAQLLAALAASHEALNSFAERLRQRDGVREVVSQVDLRRFEATTTWEAFVDAELHNSSAICWWLEVREAEGARTVDTRVLSQADERQETMIAFPETKASTVAELISRIEAATADLESSAESNLVTAFVESKVSW